MATEALPETGRNGAEKPAPYILAETGDFAVVFKPPRMHCAPLRAGEGGTLLDWYAASFPGVVELRGRKKGEGGLLHRLDFETNGLVLFAKNQGSLDRLLAQQAGGNFSKEYLAICRKAASPPPSFPPPPVRLGGLDGFAVESFFRPFGPGRKQVRPVVGAGGGETATDRGGPYRTEVFGVSNHGPGDPVRFAVRLKRGFRHQVRCHLAWIGFPILNDPLYDPRLGPAAEGFLALRAIGLSFYDPRSGDPLEFRVGPLELPANSM